MRTRIMLFLLVAVITTAQGEPWNEEQHLVSVLWEADRYDAGTRPVKNFSQAVRVGLKVDVFTITHFNSKTQELSAGTAFKLWWEDERLRWNPDNYTGLEFLSVPAATVWYPRIEVLNVYDKTRIIEGDTEVLVTSEGIVHVGVSLIHKTECYLEQEEFPFDAQHCMFRIGTRSTPSRRVWIAASEADNPRDHVNTVVNWRLEGITVSTELAPSCITHDASGAPCQRPSQASVSVSLRREPVFYLVTVMGPCTVLTLIASVIFWLPPECGEKLSFGVSILLGFTVFQLIVQEALVEAGNGKPSVLMRYVLFNFLLAGTALIVSALTVTLHHRGNPEGGSRGSELCSKCLLQDSVGELIVDQTIEDDMQKSREKLQSKVEMKKKSRNWRQTAKCLDRVFFVLYYVAYAVFTGVLVGEVVLM